MLKLGAYNISKVYLGGQAISKAYLGSNLVYSAAQPLPYDAEVEYLESTGTQWIDTGIVPQTNTKIQLGVYNLEDTGYVILGYLNDPSGDGGYRLFNAYRNVFFDMVYPNRIHANGSTTFLTNCWYEFEIGNFYVKNLSTGEVVVSGNYTEYTGTSSITLNHSASPNINSRNRWKYVDIYEGEKLVQSLRAVRVGTVGYMYDRVSGQLLGNSGTGDFIIGPDKPYDYEVAYIERDYSVPWLVDGASASGGYDLMRYVDGELFLEEQECLSAGPRV